MKTTSWNKEQINKLNDICTALEESSHILEIHESFCPERSLGSLEAFEEQFSIKQQLETIENTGGLNEAEAEQLKMAVTTVRKAIEEFRNGNTHTIETHEAHFDNDTNGYDHTFRHIIFSSGEDELSLCAMTIDYSEGERDISYHSNEKCSSFFNGTKLLLPVQLAFRNLAEDIAIENVELYKKPEAECVEAAFETLNMHQNILSCLSEQL